MIPNNEMIFTSEDGKDIKCSVISTFTLNGVNYIAYTDGTKADDGKDELYVSKYSLENGTIKLDEITSDYEWKQVDKYLDENLFDEDIF